MSGRKPVMNLQEAAVDLMLQDYAKEHGYRIGLKMRLRDVIDLDEGALTGRERNFLFTSHLDFVAFDARTHLPVLAVEYDGNQHLTSEHQIERDRIKDGLVASAGVPLLRIDNKFTRKEGRWRVLQYILWAHETGKTFHEAQSLGTIPWDEPFDHTLVLTRNEVHGGHDLTSLDLEANKYLIGFRRSHDVLWERKWSRWTGPEFEVREVVSLANGLYLHAHCGVRQFAIDGISAMEIADELCRAELGWVARDYEQGLPVASRYEQIETLIASMECPSEPGSGMAGWQVVSTSGRWTRS